LFTLISLHKIILIFTLQLYLWLSSCPIFTNLNLPPQFPFSCLSFCTFNCILFSATFYLPSILHSVFIFSYALIWYYLNVLHRL
jgi:hypothetical protein